MIVIPGRAIPKARMTQRGKWNKRARRTLAYQQVVADVLRLCCKERFAGPVRLTGRFYFANRKHGDLANLVKLQEDALQYAGIIRNDRQILQYGKGTGIYYCTDPSEERVELEIAPL